MDILKGRFLREHKDIDCFTLNLLDVKDDMDAVFHSMGYTTEFIAGIDMFKIHRGTNTAVINRLEYDGETAMWRHIGNEGTFFFPPAWLEDTPRSFYNTQVFVSGIEFEYCVKARVELLNPSWHLREEDKDALEYWTECLQRKRIDPGSVLRLVRSENPYWTKRGG